MQIGSSVDVSSPVVPEPGPQQGGLLNRLSVGLFAPVDIASLVFLRIAFGGVMLWEVWRYFENNWIYRYYMRPTVYMTYFGFGWVKPWPGRGMYWHFVALGVLSVCIAVGYYYRVAAALFFLGFTYVFLLDQTRYLNHFYMISLLSFLLIFLPVERAFSLDARRRPNLHSDTAPAWCLWIVRAQLGIVYFFGGIAKLSSDWLHGEPMRGWLAARMDFPVIGAYFKEEWMVYQFVIGGLLLDLLIVPLLLWKRTRVYAFVAAAAFHLLNARLFTIGIFPWFMLLATLLFFPPDLPRRIVRAMGFVHAARYRRPKRSAKETPAVAASLSPRQKSIVAVLAVYFVVQIFLPLRHFLYPGDVNWTEEGHNFSWHMKLRDKEGSASFTISDPDSGQEWKVNLRKYLTSRQRSKVVTRPDMILQFSRYLAEEKRREGFENVEVRVRAMTSLNGRERQLLIDPTVDLAKQPRNLLPAPWIVPLTEPLVRRDASSKETHTDLD